MKANPDKHEACPTVTHAARARYGRLKGEVGAPSRMGHCECGADSKWLADALTTKSILWLCPACVVKLIARGPANIAPKLAQKSLRERRVWNDAMLKRIP